MLRYFVYILIATIFLSCGGKVREMDATQQLKHQEDSLKKAAISVSSKPRASATPENQGKQMITKAGYRVQISPGPSREEANTAKEIFLKRFTEYEIYMVYEEPSFRARVGDFLSKGEAQKLCDKLRKVKGLEGSFVVKSKVQVEYIPPAEVDTSAYYILVDSLGNESKIYY